MKGSHSADKIVILITKFLEEFGINVRTDLVATCNDGAAVMVKYGKLLEALSQLCYNHGIQLAIVSTLYEKTAINTTSQPDQSSEDEEDVETTVATDDEEEEGEDSLSEFTSNDFVECSGIKETIEIVRKTVKFFRKSTLRRGVLEKFSKKEYDKSLCLILDCRTRWSSLFKMTERFSLMEKAINLALGDLGKTKIASCHFQTLKVLNTMLEPVCLVVNELSKKDSNLLTAEGSIEYLLTKLDEINHPLSIKLKDNIKDNIRYVTKIKNCSRFMRVDQFLVVWSLLSPKIIISP
jgi:hypothetical protein